MKAIAETEDKVVIGSDFMDYRGRVCCLFFWCRRLSQEHLKAENLRWHLCASRKDQRTADTLRRGLCSDQLRFAARRNLPHSFSHSTKCVAAADSLSLSPSGGRVVSTVSVADRVSRLSDDDILSLPVRGMLRLHFGTSLASAVSPDSRYGACGARFSTGRMWRWILDAPHGVVIVFVRGFFFCNPKI